MILLPASSTKYKGLLSCLAAGFFSFYNVFQLSILNIIGNDIANDFNLSSTELGFFSSAFLWANSIGLLFLGYVLDRFNIRKTALVSLIIAVLAPIFLAISTNMSLNIFIRFIQGLSSAVSLLISSRLAIRWFHQDQNTVIGMVTALALLGGFFSNQVFINILALVGWRKTLIMSSIFGLVIYFIMFLFLHDTYEKIFNELNWSLIKRTILNKANIYFGIFIGLANLPIVLLASLWGPKFLMITNNLDSQQSATVSSFIFIGLIIGAPVIGKLSDLVQAYIKIIRVFIIGEILSTVPFLFNIDFSLFWLMFFFFFIGFFSSAQILSYQAITKNNSKLTISIAMSIAFFIDNLLAAIAQPFFGWISQKFQYHSTIIFLIIAYMIGWLLTLLFPKKENAVAI